MQFVVAMVSAVRLLAEAFVGSLRHNVGMGVLALALSTSIWAFVTNEQNPPRTGVFPFRIPVQPVNVPAELDVLGGVDPVVVRITAPTDLWAGLREADFEATVDLADRGEGSAEEPVTLRARDPRVRVLEVVPPQVTVQLDTLRRQVVPVQVNVQQVPPLGFSFGTSHPETQQVTVLGPERLVSSVDAAMADVNLSSSRSDIRQSFPLVARTARGYDISGVRLEPQSVVIEIPIRREITPITLPVLANIEGDPAPGFWISQVRVLPQVINLVGPLDVLQPLGNVRTAPLDVNGITASISRSASLDLPLGVTPLDRNTVQVEVTVQPARGNATVLVSPQLRGLASGLTAASETPSVGVTVSGEGPSLRDFNPSRVQVVANLEGLGPGSYDMEPEVMLPAGLDLAQLSPPRVRIRVEPTP